jgi:NitT/TauT family transport system substrate-binding protein
VFYAPQYVAIALGYFEEEGLEIELTNGGGADKSMAALLSNGADIGLMGPEASLYVYLEGKTDHAVAFGQLTKRDGSFLVGRTQIADFDFSMLNGKEIISGRPSGVPAMTFKYMLNTVYNLQETNGAADNYVKLKTDVDFNATTGAFAGGAADFVTAFEPAASQLVADGYGFILASVGASSGEVPYTAYQCLKSYYNKNAAVLKSFLKAVQRGLDYINTHTADEVAALLSPQFAGTTVGMLSKAITNYKGIDAWNATPVMKEADFNRLQDIIQNAGELSKRVEFSKVIYNGYADGIK